MKKRLLSLLLAFAMLLSLLPMAALADSSTVISEVEVWGLDKPVVGQEPDWDAVLIGNPNYTVEEPAYSFGYINGIRWYDMAEERYLSRGDVFVEGHEYEVSISLKAKEGYSFDSCTDNITATTSLYETSVALSFYGIDPTEYITVLPGTRQDTVCLTPLPSYSLYIVGGTAYNDSGKVITSAAAGQTVTLVADDADFGWEFDQWMVMGDAEVAMDDCTATTTTFEMPAQDLTIMTGWVEAEKVPVEALTVTVRGYYVGTHVSCLQAEFSDHVNAQQLDSGLYYYLFKDNNGNPGSAPLTDGTIASGQVYWMAMILEPEFGYSLDELTAEQVTCSQAQKIMLTTNSDGYRVLWLQLKTPLRLLGGFKTVTVEGGTAFNNLSQVSYAAPNVTLMLIPTGQDGMLFHHWEVVSGGVTISDPMAELPTFRMGSSDVTIKAVYMPYIEQVQLEAVIPEDGADPCYDVTLPADAGYELDPEICAHSRYFRNGVAWRDIDTEEYLDPDTGFFEVDHTYELIVMVRTKTNREFLCNDSGYHQVSATINGESVYVDSANGNDSYQLAVSYSYYVAPFTGFELYGMTMSLGNSLAANFVVRNSDLVGDGHVATITKFYSDGSDPVVHVIPQSEWQDYGSWGSYFTFQGVTAKEMTDEFAVNIYDANGKKVMYTYTRTIEDYCYSMIVREEAKASPNTENLALYVDILKYGAAAQKYFDYNISTLATDQLSENRLAYGTKDVTMTDIRVKGEGYMGSTLSLKSRISMNFVYKNAVIDQAAYAEVSFTNHYGEPKETTVQASEFLTYGTTGKYIVVEGMAVADCSQVITVTLHDANGNVLSTSVDSVEAYIARMANADPVYLAIMKLATSAYNYFH